MNTCCCRCMLRPALMVVFLANSMALHNGPNMNGEYLLSKTPNAPKGPGFPTDFKDFPGGVDFFDVYHGPLNTTYGQVWWTSTSNDLPSEIVERFKGKVMAIVGMEQDQVRRTPQGDVSVPINVAYNHHHDTAVVGHGSTMVKMDKAHPDFQGVGRHYVRLDHGMAWVPVEHTPSQHGVATSAMFSDGNGGEYRKSFHAYAPPFAQMVDSPTTLSGSPMQIDTWNREKMDITGGPFVSGPVPRRSLAPTTGPDAIYSGILECPLTTRIQKIFAGGASGYNDTYVANVFGCGGSSASQCTHPVRSVEECFAHASHIDGLANLTVATKTVINASLPPGCTVSLHGQTADVVFNTAASSVCCAGGELKGTAESLVWMGVELSARAGNATITLEGPDSVWFGVGFGATLMAESPYAIIVDGAGQVSERKMANHAAGSAIAASLRVLANTVKHGRRTVLLTRALKGLTKDHYSFSTGALSLDFINAVGSGPTLGYHKESTAATLHLWPGTSPACVCKQPAVPFGQGTGMLKYLPTGETIGFPANRCAPQPREDILAQRNPTCDLREYVGGLMTCHHGWHVLDADQEVPWADQPLVYYKKFRIYFQEYNASFHKQIQRQDWGIAADGDHSEYDVPQCVPGTPTQECTHTITGSWVPVPASQPDMYLVAAHHHCHAPTCLKVELWNNDTGDLLCSQEPVYGGTKGNWTDNSRFTEPGYIATPPCLWGSAEHGLEAPPMVSGMTIKVVAVTNSTYGHHGEMALPEISLVQGPL